MDRSFFEWDPNKYSVSVPAMDREHQELIHLMNHLHELNQQKSDKKVIVTAFENLLKYAEKHFQDEEAFFFSLPHYPLAQAHKKIHDDITNKLNDFFVKFKAQPSSQLPDDFFNFLKIWLSAHIAGIDKKYGEVAQYQKRSA
ncbi:MAG: bacteriohemerythrin [Bdellovibrionaceae bacterium]|nr:bacteriohemerythrin [Pseudobdellovibrionaceae bacterium]MDW8191208.1 bacteriohemerythrin [Pseudobdellovibrionaceae bacterium]